ncbi:MAG: hypothetical protein Q9196_001175 [Gyalolechia fulgens]
MLTQIRAEKLGLRAYLFNRLVLGINDPLCECGRRYTALVGLGYTAWSTYMINEYWKLKNEFTYAYENMNDQVFERSVETFLYVDCPSLESRNMGRKQHLVGAVIYSAVVDVAPWRSQMGVYEVHV